MDFEELKGKLGMWKNGGVRIIAIYNSQKYTYGLGDDDRVYVWVWSKGDWKKNWNYDGKQMSNADRKARAEERENFHVEELNEDTNS